jgi:hydroxyethylthiazole kinase-like sugar kinase family protein
VRDRTFAVSNGHELLGRITGSGCVLGTIISLALAVNRGDKLLAALSGKMEMRKGRTRIKNGSCLECIPTGSLLYLIT